MVSRQYFLAVRAEKNDLKFTTLLNNYYYGTDWQEYVPREML